MILVTWSHLIRWDDRWTETNQGATGKWGRIAKFLTPAVTEGSWSWHWYIPAVKERQVYWDDSKARPWMLNLNCSIMFDTEERHSGQWFDQSRAKKIIFLLAFWMNIHWGQYSPVTVFWSISVSDMASVCAVLGHQMHRIKDLNGQNKPFLSGPFLRLVAFVCAPVYDPAILM